MNESKAKFSKFDCSLDAVALSLTYHGLSSPSHAHISIIVVILKNIYSVRTQTP